MQKRVKQIIATICFLVLLVLSINKVTDILSRKDSVIKYHDITDDEYDVLFFGTSHAINGIYPMELWKDYGIVSYNCAGHGNRLPTTYWMLENVLKKKKIPKVVVIDVFLLESNEKIRPERPGIDQQHISFDWMEASKQKMEMVNFLLDDVETKMEFIIPITIYHDRWKEVSKNDFDIPYGTGKGAEYRVNRAVPNDFELVSKDEMITNDTLGKQYLCKMIELCQSKEIEVLLTNIPYPASADQQKWANSVELIAQKYGVKYLNMFYENTEVNFFTDCYDENSHLNPSGARRVTKYIGKFLQSEYGITDRRQDKQFTHWYSDYEKYTKDKWDAIRDSKNDLWNYLSLLQDSNLDICLFFNGDSEMIYWGTPPKLVENIADLRQFKTASSEKKDYLLILDNGRGNVYEYVGSDCVTNRHTSFADITYTTRGSDDIRELYINGNEQNYLLNDDGTMAEIAIVSFDKNTGEMVDYARFNQNINVAGQ